MIDRWPGRLDVKIKIDVRTRRLPKILSPSTSRVIGLPNPRDDAEHGFGAVTAAMVIQHKPWERM